MAPIRTLSKKRPIESSKTPQKFKTLRCFAVYGEIINILNYGMNGKQSDNNSVFMIFVYKTQESNLHRYNATDLYRTWLQIQLLSDSIKNPSCQIHCIR